MTSGYFRRCVLALLIVLAVQVQAAERRYALADRGAIALSVPEGWREEIRSPGQDLPPTIVWHPQKGTAFQMLVTPIWPFEPGVPRATTEELRQAAGRAAESVRSQALEMQIAIEALRGRGVFGFYFAVTDRAPKPGEYRYMTQGILALDELRVTFTILTNDPERDAVVAAGLEMLRNARRERPAAPAR